MEGRVWDQLREVIAELPVPPQLDHRCTYSTRLILLIACYAYLKDRPQNWACNTDNWPPDQCPDVFPHPGQLSRRLNTPAVAKLFEQLWERVGDRLGPPSRGTAAVDGKALTIGGATTDRDATRGRAGGGFGWGYKLHAIVAADGRVAAATVEPLNRNEMPIARQLFPAAARRLRPGTTIAGDGEYVADYLLTEAQDHGLLFLAPMNNGRVGRDAIPERRGAAYTLTTRRGQKMMRDRVNIERRFSQLCGTAYGLKGLPPWVRGLGYVRRFVAVKLAVHHCHLAVTAK